MVESPQLQWPPIDSAYTDEFGVIDAEVYLAAAAVWQQAERFALSTLGDAPAGQRLMMKAAANVSRVRAAAPDPIQHLPSYLFQSYKRLVLAEVHKENGHRQSEAWLHAQAEAGIRHEAEEADRRILLDEILAMMDDWTRQVFNWRVLGHSFAEIAVWLETSENAARNKYNQHVARLAESLNNPAAPRR
jgi:hypothetical protein